MPETDVSKMKVADLKRELKMRGLTTTGNKMELQERLQAALIEGDISLDDTAISDELGDEVNFTDDDDKLLVDENELLNSPINTPADYPLLASCSSVIASGEGAAASNEPVKGIGGIIRQATNVLSTPVPAKKIVLKRENNLMSNQHSNSSNGSMTTNSPGVQSENNGTTNSPKIVRRPIVALAGASTDNLKLPIKLPLSMEERLALRAKRFGVTIPKSSSVNAVTAATITAIRKTSSASILANKGEKETEEKQLETLKRRAERFGCIISNKLVKQNAEAKLQKRKERFGLTNKPEGKTTTPISLPALSSSIGSTSNVWAEKALARLKRFKTTIPEARDN